MEDLRIGIISDLHCCYPHENSSNITYLHSDSLPVPVLRNPIEALKKISNDLTLDMLLCPGDITDKSDQQGLKSGWAFIEDLNRHFNSQHLVATLGNHDVDFKRKYASNFEDLPRRLSKNFPTKNELSNQAFWSDRFFLLVEENFILFVFNSVFSFTSEDTVNKPQIDQAILERIEEKLSPYKADKRYKVAMCHHHPVKHSNMDYPDDDTIENGDKLLILLNDNNFQLFIHGHKHDPRLSYLHSLPVLGAGSFSSLMNLTDLGAENVFHIITLKPMEPKGTIRSWVYGPQSGWRVKNDSYFPCFTGFGFITNLEAFADQCADWFQNRGKDIELYKELKDTYPDIQYLIPSDQEKLNLILKQKHHLEFTPELPNLPKIISKLVV